MENHQSLKERDFIVIHVKRQQGQVLIHQQKQWKKFYKYVNRKVSTKADGQVHLYQTQPYMTHDVHKTRRCKFLANTMLLLSLRLILEGSVALLLFQRLPINCWENGLILLCLLHHLVGNLRKMCSIYLWKTFGLCQWFPHLNS